MGLHTVDAIVLRQYPYRETSVLLACLTDRAGKIKGIIKGLRGERTTRYRSPMQILTLNRIVFYDSRNSPLHLISQCELLNDYRSLTQDLETIRLAASCAELCDVLLEPDEPQPLVFELLKNTLDRLSMSSHDRPSVRVHFILRLLRLVGFQPRLDDCASCARHPDGEAYWSNKQGGVLCARCLHEDPRAEQVSPEWLQRLAICAEADQPVSMASELAQPLQRRLDEFLRWRVDRPLKAMRMVT